MFILSRSYHQTQWNWIIFYIAYIFPSLGKVTEKMTSLWFRALEEMDYLDLFSWGSDLVIAVIWHWSHLLVSLAILGWRQYIDSGLPWSLSTFLNSPRIERRCSSLSPELVPISGREINQYFYFVRYFLLLSDIYMKLLDEVIRQHIVSIISMLIITNLSNINQVIISRLSLGVWRLVWDPGLA